LISSFTPLWLNRIWGVVSDFLHVLKFGLCPKVPILEKIPWAPERNVYHAAAE
jgi:hypothetical protein